MHLLERFLQNLANTFQLSNQFPRVATALAAPFLEANPPQASVKGLGFSSVLHVSIEWQVLGHNAASHVKHSCCRLPAKRAREAPAPLASPPETMAAENQATTKRLGLRLFLLAQGRNFDLINQTQNGWARNAGSTAKQNSRWAQRFRKQTHTLRQWVCSYLCST